MADFGAWTLLPPVAALAWALWRKQIYPALLLGIWLGWLVIEGFDPIHATAGTVEAIVGVFRDAGNVRILTYSLLVGSVLTLVTSLGGVQGLVNRLSDRRWVTDARGAQMVPFVLGLLITVESSITALIAGTVGRPLTDLHRVSREKLAYVCDSTSAPICILVPFNGWGATVIGLLAVQDVANPVAVLLSSIRWNFYPMIAILIVLVTIWTRRDFGPMAAAQHRAKTQGLLHAEGSQPMVADEVLATQPAAGIEPRASHLVLPVATMVLAILAGLIITGRRAAPPGADVWQTIQASSGSTAVLWAVLASLGVCWLLARIRRVLPGSEFQALAFKGMGGMVPVVTLLLLAFALGDTVKTLGTGAYVAEQIAGVASHKLAVAGSFILAGVMAFATGTSWGTFALMIPIAVPLAAALGGPLPLYVGAVLGGGVFGDHCSPISDTTIISSMASASDHMDHVRTQLPYAVVGGLIATGLYLVVA